VCISGGVYDQIRNKLSLSFKPLGELSYKNIPQAVRTFAIAGGDGLGPLPAPQGQPGKPSRKFPLGVAAAVLAALLIAGGGLWAWSDYRHRADDAAREGQLAAEKRAAEDARHRAEMERLAAAAAEQKADLAAERLAAEEARRQADAARAKSEPGHQVAATPDPAHTAEPAGRDGLYGGEICYGPGEREAARCYKAQAILQKGKISGEWPGRGAGVTMRLAGDVSRTGDVVIHMHGERADGTHFAVIDLAGSLRDGRIEAKGAFRSGRSATLDWRKN
jgi:hypothetical protein